MLGFRYQIVKPVKNMADNRQSPKLKGILNAKVSDSCRCHSMATH